MRLRPIVPFLVVLVSLAASNSLHAQFRMPRPRLPGASRGAAAARTPEFDDRVREITDARLTAFMRGLAAEQGSVSRFKAAERRQADLEAAAEVRRRADTRTDAQRQAAADAEERRGRQCYENTPIYKDAHGPDRDQRAQAAVMRVMQTGDPAAMKKFTDSLQNAAMSQDSLLKVAARGCGLDASGNPLPPESERAVEQVYIRDSLVVVGTGASGMERVPYQMMRERVLAFLASEPGETARASMAFSATEIRVLEAKRRDLGRYQELLSDY